MVKSWLQLGFKISWWPCIVSVFWSNPLRALQTILSNAAVIQLFMARRRPGSGNRRQLGKSKPRIYDSSNVVFLEHINYSVIFFTCNLETMQDDITRGVLAVRYLLLLNTICRIRNFQMDHANTFVFVAFSFCFLLILVRKTLKAELVLFLFTSLDR